MLLLGPALLLARRWWVLADVNPVGQLALECFHLLVQLTDLFLIVPVQVQRVLQGDQVLQPIIPFQRFYDSFLAGSHPRISQLGECPQIPLPGQNGIDNRQAGDARYVANHMAQLDIHLLQRFLHVLDMFRRKPNQFAAIPQQRPHPANGLLRPVGPRSKPTECRNCNHWQSSTSVFFPGTFLKCRALTRHTSNLSSASTCPNGIQYTPVDSIATLRMPHCFSHAAICRRLSVKLSKQRTGSASRSAGTATKISVAPISMPAVSACRMGSESTCFTPFLARFLRSALRAAFRTRLTDLVCFAIGCLRFFDQPQRRPRAYDENAFS